MELSDLKNLDLKNVASAPWPVRGVVLGLICLAVLAGGYFLHLSDALSGLSDLENEEKTLRETFTQKKFQARHLELYRKRLDEAEQRLAVMLKQLPNRSEIDALLTDINQAGLQRGLQFELFRPQEPDYQDFYAVIPIAIKVNGGYHEIASFVSDVAHLTRIVTVHDLNLTAAKEGELLMEATLKAYRSLDESEAAAVRKQADGKKPGERT